MKPLRTCGVCGLEAYNEEDLDLFVKDKRKPHGRNTLCKKCYNEYRREWRGPSFYRGLMGRPPEKHLAHWFWFRWDQETWCKGMPAASWCFQGLLETGDIGYLIDAIMSTFPDF